MLPHTVSPWSTDDRDKVDTMLGTLECHRVVLHTHTLKMQGVPQSQACHEAVLQPAGCGHMGHRVSGRVDPNNPRS